MKKIETEKPNLIFSISTLQKICVSKKPALISALPTLCKLLTQRVSVSDIVIVKGIFGHLKVVHLNSLDLQCAVKEGKKKIHFQPVFETRVLQELQCREFFSFVFGFCNKSLVLEVICSGSDYYNASTIANVQKSSKITCLRWIRISY